MTIKLEFDRLRDEVAATSGTLADLRARYAALSCLDTLSDPRDGLREVAALARAVRSLEATYARAAARRGVSPQEIGSLLGCRCRCVPGPDADAPHIPGDSSEADVPLAG